MNGIRERVALGIGGRLARVRRVSHAIRSRMYPDHPGWPAVLGPVQVRQRRIALRPAQMDDAAAWVAAVREDRASLERWWRTDPRPWHERITTREWRAQCEGLLRAARRGYALPFALVVDGRFAGQFTLDRIDRAHGAAEVGVWVARDYRDGVVVVTAMRLLLQHAFGALGLYRVVAPIDVDNRPAAAAAARVGFRREGVMRGYLDVGGQRRDHVLWAILREDFTS
ncbi:ribosomal-protein-alanine N-acetyltransferase [Longimycelium tulufanense]|uniref:Ribosomal-protein-alanine N-acetyltransferase n=1 Tax=Longimycelium tulufanense TaxID=907463 RepID=A0A8J3C7V9_9PSEU|nr:GNAT family protein [Longimycelium tulufanense]GGM50901.1 ribosomal-protein-alanine N-acetyltransferase [Longimycelium tulufanense]